MEPGGGRETVHLILFVVISLVLHVGLVAGLRLFAPDNAPAESTEPIVVDVVDLPAPKEAVIDKQVVALPDTPVEESPVPKRPDFYSDRNQSVVRQTVPGAVEPGPPDPDQVVVPAPSPPPAAAPAPDRTPAPAPKKAEGPGEPAEKARSRAGSGSEGAEGAGETGAASGPDGVVTAAVPVGSEAAGSGDGASESAAPGEAGPAAPPAGAAPGGVRLFPSEQRLAELAEKYRASSPKGEVGKTLQLNTAELKYQKYTLGLKPIIELRMGNSEIFRRGAWQGVAYIDFTINRDGTLDKVIIRRSSGIPALDDDAVTALRLAEPFPPFPDHFLVEKITIKGKFEYLR